VGEHLFHAHRVEHRLRFAQPDAGGRDPQQNAPPVARIAIAPDVCAPLQAIDGQRHRGHRDAHVPGQVGDGHRVDLVEVIEDAGLMRADRVAADRVGHVPRVAREVDPGVGVEHLPDVTIAYFTLLCQTKLLYQREGARS
jgi:hypothetical protein